MDNGSISILHSALWAAYADALGFMSELTDRTGLRRRIHADRVQNTMGWRRSVGGRFGAIVDLPAGAYSDDTQLRLSCSRAIRGDGFFDVEAFARVELPVWLSYSLGAGSGTKAAARHLAHPNTNWFSNFFESKQSSYVLSGGNGAAMRIQPHVWAARNKQESRTFLVDVIRNAISTHGHTRAIAGAVIHALGLAVTLCRKEVPSPNDWTSIVEQLELVPALLQQDSELASIWLPFWQECTKAPFSDAWKQVKRECLEDAKLMASIQLEPTELNYEALVKQLGGLDVRTRGSGTKTALIALGLSWMFRREPTSSALLTAANLLESDTDTIATMTGALLGAISTEEPMGNLQDRNYIVQEASRLADVSFGKHADSFNYPDLMRWNAPRTQSDVVTWRDGSPSVMGLGQAAPLSSPVRGQGKDSGYWQWLRLDFGQTIVAKVRADLAEASQTTRTQTTSKGSPSTMEPPIGIAQKPLFQAEQQAASSSPTSRTLHDLTTEAINAGFEPKIIGAHILELSTKPDGIEQCIAYVAIISKARLARSSRTKPV